MPWRKTVLQRSVIFALSAVALGALAPVACTQNFGQFEATASTGNGTGSSAGGASGASSSAAGTPTGNSSGSGNAACTATTCDDGNLCTDDACNQDTGACSHAALQGAQPEIDDSNPCTVDLCDNGAETHENVPEGTQCGDTTKLICDGNGSCVGCVNAGQCPVIGECTVATCVSQACSIAKAPVGTVCSTGKCSGAGACVQCLGDADCNGSICTNNQCVDGCSDGTKNGTETDVDCGGAQCSGCPTGKKCSSDMDCDPGPCLGGICNACADTVKNGLETDVDCGGSQCPKCVTGKVCKGNTDCESNSCKSGICN
jgi:hypothetical protein